MKEFIKYLKNEDLIQKLLEYYKINQIRPYIDFYLENFFENCNEHINREVFKNESDPLDSNFNSLGKFYEKSLPQTERKKLGEFYTPKSIVKYILKAIGYIECRKIYTRKLVDLSCGTGSFIILAIRILVKSCIKSINKHKISEISPKEARTIISKVKKNIIGMDINPVACILCQINIYIELFELLKIIRNQDKSYHFPVFNIINSNALTNIESEVYDYVVGNPPYLFIRDIPNDQKRLIEDADFSTQVGQYDYYQIFIELGIRLLKNKGKLGYIIPDSILVLSNRAVLRKYIYNNTKIREIYNVDFRFQDPIVSNVIIILEKENAIQERERNFIKIVNSDQSHRELIQKKIKEWNYKFLIHLNNEDISIIDHLNKNFPKLDDLVNNTNFKIILSRGIELTKKGEIVFCTQCRKYFPIPKKAFICPECNNPLEKEHVEIIIFKSMPDEDPNKYNLFVNSINRYMIKDYNFIKTNKKGISYKDSKIYRDHIIIRQLSQDNRVCAAYDEKLSLTSQSFYNLRILKSPIREFNNLYLLGIINSKLLSYFFLKLFGSYKKLFPRILIEKVKSFPIIVPKNDKEKEWASHIIDKVKIMLNLKQTNIARYSETQREIDNLIFKLYNISDSSKEYILDFLNGN